MGADAGTGAAGAARRVLLVRRGDRRGHVPGVPPAHPGEAGAGRSPTGAHAAADTVGMADRAGRADRARRRGGPRDRRRRLDVAGPVRGRRAAVLRGALVRRAQPRPPPRPRAVRRHRHHRRRRSHRHRRRRTGPTCRRGVGRAGSPGARLDPLRPHPDPPPPPRPPLGATDAFQVAAALAAIAATVVDHRVVVGATAVVLLALAQTAALRRPVPPAKIVGLRQMAMGLAVVAATAAGVHALT